MPDDKAPNKDVPLAGVARWEATRGPNLQAAIQAITGTAPSAAEPGPEAGADIAPDSPPAPTGAQAVPIGGFLRYGTAGTRILTGRTPVKAPPRPPQAERKAPRPLPLVPFQGSDPPAPAEQPAPAPAAPSAPSPTTPVGTGPAPAFTPPRARAKPKARRQAEKVPLLVAASIDANALALMAIGGGDPIPHPATVAPARTRNGREADDSALKRTVSLKVSEEDYALITAFGAAMYPVAKPHEVLRGWIAAQVGAIRRAQGSSLPRRGPW